MTRSDDVTTLSLRERMRVGWVALAALWSASLRKALAPKPHNRTAGAVPLAEQAKAH